MAAFLLFVYIFANQVIGGLNTKLPPPSSYGNTITFSALMAVALRGLFLVLFFGTWKSPLRSMPYSYNIALINMSEFFLYMFVCMFALINLEK
jgi:hypothetical protein